MDCLSDPHAASQRDVHINFNRFGYAFADIYSNNNLHAVVDIDS